MAANLAGRSLNRLFVNNLPWTVSHRELLEYFSQYGHVNSSKVIFDRTTGISQRYGFVDFAARNAADEALSKKEHMLEGNILNVQLSN